MYVFQRLTNSGTDQMILKEVDQNARREAKWNPFRNPLNFTDISVDTGLESAVTFGQGLLWTEQCYLCA